MFEFKLAPAVASLGNVFHYSSCCSDGIVHNFLRVLEAREASLQETCFNEQNIIDTEQMRL